MFLSICFIKSLITADLPSYIKSKKSISSIFQRLLILLLPSLLSDVDVSWNFINSKKSDDSKTTTIVRIKFCKIVYCCWLKSISCQLFAISIDVKSIKTIIRRKSIVCRSLFALLLKNEFNRLFSVNSMLCIDTDVIRNTKTFNAVEIRLWINENKNVNNKFDVKKVKKKNDDLLFLMTVI